MRKLTKAVSVAAAVAMTATCFSTTAFADDTLRFVESDLSQVVLPYMDRQL